MRKRVTVIIAAILMISLLAICLVACNPEENPDVSVYRDRLEAKGYDSFNVVDKTEIAGYSVKWVLSAAKGGAPAEGENPATPVEEYVMVVQFESADAANAYKAVVEADAEFIASGDSIEVVDSVVFRGTEQGIADAKA